MDKEQATFSGNSAQDDILAVEEAKAWIEVGLCTFKVKTFKQMYLA